MARSGRSSVTNGVLFGAAALGLWAVGLQARPDGVSGRAQSPIGCSCHASTPDQNGPAAVTIAGPRVVRPGSTHQYTIAVRGGPPGQGGGFDLAKTGGMWVPGPNTMLLNDDLVHSTDVGRSWTFGWTAPATEGDYDLYAIGMASNGRGTGGDSWSWYGHALETPYTIRVRSRAEVEGEDRNFWLAHASPNPTAGPTRIEFSLDRPAPVRLEVFNVAGRRVAVLAEGVLPSGVHYRTWAGRSDSGLPVTSGRYLVLLRSAGRSLSRPVMYLR